MLAYFERRSFWHLVLPSFLFVFAGLYALQFCETDVLSKFLCIVFVLLHLLNFKMNKPVFSLFAGVINLILIAFLGSILMQHIASSDHLLWKNFHYCILVLGAAEVLLLLHLCIASKTIIR